MTTEEKLDAIAERAIQCATACDDSNMADAQHFFEFVFEILGLNFEDYDRDDCEEEE